MPSAVLRYVTATFCGLWDTHGSLKCLFVAGNKPGADVGTQFARF